MKTYTERINSVPEGVANGKLVAASQAAALLISVIDSGDRIVLEGDNQKQAVFLARQLAQISPDDIRDLHILMSAVSLDEHLDLFRKGLASRLDFAFSGPQAVALAKMAKEQQVRIGAIHTYAELYARYFTDLIPNVALVCGELADPDGNLYLGANTEDTPVICEATHAAKGIVIAQVREIRERLPRVDIPGDQLEYVIVAGEGPRVEPLFTRDPAHITANQVLMAMMVIKGIYAEYGVERLNHGIGYATAAVELLLPTYGRELGLKGRVCRRWVLNPHPTLIPAIEAGFVDSIYAFGSEPGMDAYIAAHPDVFFTCHANVLRSNRMIAHLAGQYAIDCFTGATLQMDAEGNSSTATRQRIAGFGGAPNLACTPGGRRHGSGAWRKAGEEHRVAQGRKALRRGRKLVVQITPTVSAKKGIPVFVDELDAVGMAEAGLFEEPPVMVYADDVTHIVTEIGMACLLRCGPADERRAAIRAVAGDTPVGRRGKTSETQALRARGVVVFPEDLGIRRADATRDRLAAQNIEDLVAISGGLYRPPARFRS